jgi:hypothetical protein
MMAMKICCVPDMVIQNRLFASNSCATGFQWLTDVVVFEGQNGGADSGAF